MDPQDLIYLEVKLYNWSQLTEEEQLRRLTRPRGRRVGHFDQPGAQNAAAAAATVAAPAVAAASGKHRPGNDPAITQHGQSAAAPRTAYQAGKGQSISAPAVMTSVTSAVAARAAAAAGISTAAVAFRPADDPTYSSVVAAQMSSECAVESSSDDGLEMAATRRPERHHQAPGGGN